MTLLDSSGISRGAWASPVRTVVVLIVALLLTAAEGMTQMTLCYLYFGTISDLGWTFTYNLGRLKVHDALAAEFPNITFSSISVQNVFFATDPHKLIHSTIRQHSCNAVLTNNDQLLRGGNDLFAATYPNVSFILLGEYLLENRDYPNRVFLANDYTAGYYAAGAAAGAQSKRCITYFSAWDSEVDPTSSFAGFLFGVRSVNATVPVHVISQGSWYNVESDQILTDMFLNQMKCDIFARYSDPYTVDLAIYNSGLDGVFSVGCHSNLQNYVGDTVLTAVYIDWSVGILDIMRNLIHTGSLDQTKVHFYTMSDGAISVAPISPLAAKEAVTAHSAAIKYANSVNGEVVCGLVRLRKGGHLLFGGNRTCKLGYSNIGDFITDDHVVAHDTYAAPSSCPAGSRFEYRFDPTLKLFCIPCTPGTLSLAPGSSVCVLCGSGETSDAGASSCVPIRVLGNSAIAGIVIGFCGLTAFVLYFSYRYITTKHQNDHAPKETPMCFIFTDIESKTVLWKLHRERMKAALDLHDAIVRAVIEQNDAYEVRKIGDGFLIATKTVVDAVIVATEIQRMLFSADWPSSLPGDDPQKGWRGLRVCMGIHVTTATGVEVSMDPIRRRYNYAGPDLLLTAKVGTLACGGQIVLTQQAYDALVSDLHYELIVANDVVIHMWAIQCKLDVPSSVVIVAGKHKRFLENLSSTTQSSGDVTANATNPSPTNAATSPPPASTPLTNLYSLLPIDLQMRRFPDCTEGIASRAQELLDVSATSTNDSFMSLNSRQSGDPTQQSGGDGLPSASAVAQSLSLLMSWVTPNKRVALIDLFMHTILSHQKRLLAEGDSESNTTTAAKNTFDPKCLRNPKRLVGALSLLMRTETCPHGQAKTKLLLRGAAKSGEARGEQNPLLPVVLPVRQ